MSTTKEIMLNRVLEWVHKLSQKDHGRAVLARAGLDDIDMLYQLTVKELRLLTALCSAAYHSGCDDSRQWAKDREVA